MKILSEGREIDVLGKYTCGRCGFSAILDESDIKRLGIKTSLTHPWGLCPSCRSVKFEKVDSQPNQSTPELSGDTNSVFPEIIQFFVLGLIIIVLAGCLLHYYLH